MTLSVNTCICQNLRVTMIERTQIRMATPYNWLTTCVAGFICNNLLKPNPCMVNPDNLSQFFIAIRAKFTSHFKWLEFIETIENALGKKAIKNMLPMQAGDVVATFAETKELRDEFGFSPSTSLEVGVGKFVDWYLDYHGNAAN